MLLTDPYLVDAATLIREGRRHRDTGNGNSLAAAALLSAAGIEHLLKAILYEVNPLYVYKEPTFAHSVSALYSNRILPAAAKSDILSAKPNHDVITYRESLRRAAVFSAVTQHNSATLYRISAVRDTVAHCRMDGLDNQKLFQLAYLDLPRLVQAYEQELGLPNDSLEGTSEDAQRKEREEHAAAKERLETRLQVHRERWARLRDDIDQFERAKTVRTAIKTSTPNGQFVEDFECPACGNHALLTAEVDFDIIDHDPIPQGAFPVRLECPFCGLVIDESHELDGVGAGDFIYALTTSAN